MKRNNLYRIAVMIIAVMASVNLNAQARRMRGDAPRSHQGREMVARPHANAHANAPVARVHQPAPRPVHHMAPMPMHHRVDAHGYLPGWGRRVRYLDGRWGYYRDSRWYWYDTYFAPDYYFAHPLSCFHAHFYGHNAAAAVGGVAAGIAVGALINVLMH